MKCIISETIIALCNSGLDFSSELSVEGLLGITLDGRDIMLVNIKEVIKSGVTGTKKSSSRTSDSISEVATSSDPAVEVFVERHATTNDVYSRNHKQRSNSSSKVTTRNQTDHVTETVKMQVKSEPEEVISINDEEGHDSIFDDTRLECYPQIGFWIENSNNTNADSVQQLVSEVAVSHSSVVQGSQSNIHTSDKFCKMVQSTTDTLCTPLKGYQQNCLGTMTTPVSLYANVLPQHVSLSAASVHRQSHTQVVLQDFHLSLHVLSNSHSFQVCFASTFEFFMFYNYRCIQLYSKGFNVLITKNATIEMFTYTRYGVKYICI